MTLVVSVSALIYVLDSHARDGLAEAFNELSKLLQEKELKDASVLIFANKQVRCADQVLRYVTSKEIFKYYQNISLSIGSKMKQLSSR